MLHSYGIYWRQFLYIYRYFHFAFHCLNEFLRKCTKLYAMHVNDHTSRKARSGISHLSSESLWMQWIHLVFFSHKSEQKAPDTDKQINVKSVSLAFLVSLTLSLPLSLILPLYLHLSRLFNKNHETSKMWNTMQTQRAAHMGEKKTMSAKGEMETDRNLSVWPGHVHLNNCPASAHISLIICRLRNQIISQRFAKSLAKKIVPPLQNVFVFGPACCPTNPHPHPVQPVVCEKFTLLLQNTAGLRGRCESVWGRQSSLHPSAI